MAIVHRIVTAHGGSIVARPLETGGLADCAAHSTKSGNSECGSLLAALPVISDEFRVLRLCNRTNRHINVRFRTLICIWRVGV